MNKQLLESYNNYNKLLCMLKNAGISEFPYKGEEVVSYIDNNFLDILRYLDKRNIYIFVSKLDFTCMESFIICICDNYEEFSKKFDIRTIFNITRNFSFKM